MTKPIVQKLSCNSWPRGKAVISKRRSGKYGPFVLGGGTGTSKARNEHCLTSGSKIATYVGDDIETLQIFSVDDQKRWKTRAGELTVTCGHVLTIKNKIWSIKDCDRVKRRPAYPKNAVRQRMARDTET